MKGFVVTFLFVLSVEKGGPCKPDILLANELVLVDCENLLPVVSLVYLLSGAEAGKNPPNLFELLAKIRMLKHTYTGDLTVGYLCLI